MFTRKLKLEIIIHICSKYNSFRDALNLHTVLTYNGFVIIIEPMNRTKHFAAAALALALCFGLYSNVMAKPKNIYAVIKTSLGDITCQLYPDKAPITVKNFVGLANGSGKWIDPKTYEAGNGPLYNGVIFHRVIPDFMVQTGDPLGNGTGGPGYRFEDEFDDSLDFSEPGILAMANSGPNTNGSQFFITVAPTTWLNRKHTIFGEVKDVASQGVVDKIAQSKTDGQDRPATPITINSVTIS